MEDETKLSPAAQRIVIARTERSINDTSADGLRREIDIIRTAEYLLYRQMKGTMSYDEYWKHAAASEAEARAENARKECSEAAKYRDNMRTASGLIPSIVEKLAREIRIIPDSGPPILASDLRCTARGCGKKYDWQVYGRAGYENRGIAITDPVELRTLILAELLHESTRHDLICSCGNRLVREGRFLAK